MASDDDKKKAQELVEQAGRLLVSLQNEPENQTQRANEALGLLDEAITLDPENDKAWALRGFAKVIWVIIRARSRITQKPLS